MPLGSPFPIKDAMFPWQGCKQMKKQCNWSVYSTVEHQSWINTLASYETDKAAAETNNARTDFDDPLPNPPTPPTTVLGILHPASANYMVVPTRPVGPTPNTSHYRHCGLSNC